ncbi:5-oxoprolinase subunit B family protein [Limimaricola pyoseonensis]|uniref:Sensor histidine kinase inhibitor, KipI family n=1 Tax=Limimaricola pyoseonensis TaxID=521013 RepID=A0A1G7FPV0_9RHOB|nr:allophanate hydrolase subunit 1 [Limimaricola pyoseonensis]SDE77946.1 sensor histidine kinase inhibitor, KipI family [Limimaricola pyoseonensis]
MELLAARPLADRAVTFELATEVGAEAAARVGAAQARLSALLEAGELPGALELSRAFCAITLHYDPLEGRQAGLVARVRAALEDTEPAAATGGRLWRLPCLYEGEDLDDLSTRLGMARDEITARHAATEHLVHAIGFLPGLPFMGGLPDGFSVPRRETPRTRVPQGSVAIANGLTVIYPFESPGGWHILGRCPVPLFDAARDAPALLSAGDRVRFAPVDRPEFDRLAAAHAAGTADPETYAEAAT